MSPNLVLLTYISPREISAVTFVGWSDSNFIPYKYNSVYFPSYAIVHNFLQMLPPREQIVKMCVCVYVELGDPWSWLCRNVLPYLFVPSIFNPLFIHFYPFFLHFIHFYPCSSIFVHFASVPFNLSIFLSIFLLHPFMLSVPFSIEISNFSLFSFVCHKILSDK